MYSSGEIVTLNVDKSEGAGAGSLHISANITGMVVNSGRNAGGNHSYIVDFGPEGQWNCIHSELNGLSGNGEDTEEWEDREDVEEEMIDLPGPEPEPALRVEAAEGSDIRDLLGVDLVGKKGKIISFEEDLARMAEEAEKEGAR